MHNPVHRQGVRYSNANVAQKFGGNRLSGGAQNRMDFRGRSGQQVLHAGAGAALGAGAGAALGTALGGSRGAAGARPRAGDLKPGGRPSGGERPSAKRPAARPTTVASRGGSNAFGNISSGRQANLQAARGRASLGGGGGGISRGGGHGISRGGAGGFARGGGGGFARGGGGRGGRRSDIRLKHDIVLLGRLDNGLGFYRFVYNGGHKAYVGVIAQEVEAVRPKAVARGADGYLRVYYDKLGLKFEPYDQWVASGARVPYGWVAH